MARKASARIAGPSVSQTGVDGPTPRNMAMPTTNTATKLTLLLITKKATERRAISIPGIPPFDSAQAPSASPPAPDAGTIDPTASSDIPSS